MLGVVVNAASSEAFSAESLFEDFLGAPLLARAIAAMLPPDETCSVQVLLPETLHERAQDEIKERFGLDEIDAFLPATGDLAKDVRDAVNNFPEDIDFVALTSGYDFLAPAGLIQKVLEGARRGRLAAAAVSLSGIIVADEDGEATPLDSAPSFRRIQGPLVLMREEVESLLQGESADWLSNAIQGETPVTLVEGDVDNLQLRGEEDLTRALEIFHRRAVDFAFIYPKDMLPEDPLKKILDDNERRLAQASENDAKPDEEATSQQDDAYNEDASIEEAGPEESQVGNTEAEEYEAQESGNET
ncbi:MAG: 2-C-methyl-D-erythritol 4-phosphate cytidylyltransferase [Deltaproteobacteria bacterium]|nr:2-C-methyl-D-erythritol 4-phosphate cytidylyltransferase [Deltaproteobacteria bacterium]